MEPSGGGDALPRPCDRLHLDRARVGVGIGEELGLGLGPGAGLGSGSESELAPEPRPGLGLVDKVNWWGILTESSSHSK